MSYSAIYYFRTYHKEGQLFGQATGQPEFEVFTESKDTFFLMVVAAKLVFSYDESGKLDS